VQFSGVLLFGRDSPANGYMRSRTWRNLTLFACSRGVLLFVSRRHDRHDFHEYLSTQAFRLGGQPAALLVCQPESPFPQLLTQDAILFAQVFDDVRLTLVHPAGNRDQHKPQRIQSFRPLETPLWLRALGKKNCSRFNQIQF
jgi:hypothetical protein